MHRAMAQHGKRRDQHGVAYSRDRADRAVSEQHREQLHKALVCKRRVMQHAVHLLKRPDHRLVQLPAFLRALRLILRLQQRLLRGEAVSKGGLLHKGRDRAHLIADAQRLPQPAPQRLDGRDGFFAQRVELCERRFILGRHLFAKTARMHAPRLLPARAADVPVIRVLLKPVARVRLQRGKIRF